MKSLISTLELTREDVERLLSMALEFKEGKKVSLEGDVALLFLEPSTRTKISFEKACKSLGLTTYSVEGQNSSIIKGESFFDTLKTFEAMGFKAVIFRVPFVLYPYEHVVRDVELALINAGDGAHQHPTQGLIDLMTLVEEFGSLEGMKLLYVGDILYSRVFRSGLPLLRMFGVQVSVCGPRTLIPRDVNFLGVENVFDDLDEAIDWADVVVWLRIQRERQKESFIPSEKSYFKRFGLNADRYKRLKGKFMHPGPVNREIDMESSLIYSDKSLILKQVSNGIWIRMAVLWWCLQ